MTTGVHGEPVSAQEAENIAADELHRFRQEHEAWWDAQRRHTGPDRSYNFGLSEGAWIAARRYGRQHDYPADLSERN